MNTELKNNAKTILENSFFTLMNNELFGKTMENVRKHRDINLATIRERKIYLVSEPNYHTRIFFFFENLLAIEMKRNTNIYE